jgi:hypothetical protein
MAEDKLTFAAIILVAIVAIVGILGMMSLGGWMPITGYSTTPTGTAKVNITTALGMELIDNSIDFQGGSVTQGAPYADIESNGTAAVNGSWAVVTDYFNLENVGNVDANVSIKINETQFMGGTAGKSWFMWSDNTAPGEAGACGVAGATELAWTEFAADNTEYRLCDTLQFENTTDNMLIYMKLRIPDDAPVGIPAALVTFTATSL